MKKSIIKQAKSTEEAIRLALSEIGKSRDEVDVEVLEEESSGFLGLIGQKDAVVRISYDEDISKALEDLEKEIKNDSFSKDKDLNDNYDVKDRSKYFKEEAEAFYESKDLKKEDKQKEEFEKESNEFESKIKDLKDHETNLGEYERNQKINSYEKNIKNHQVNDENLIDELLDDDSDKESKKESFESQTIVVDQKSNIAYEKQQTDIDKYYKAKEFLEDILREMHLEDVSVYGNLEGSMIKLDAKVDEKDTGIAIGKQGSTLDAIELLVRKAISSRANNLRVNIDINNYKKRRDEKIRELAAETAEKVAKSKKAWNLKYMNSYERRLAHEEISKHSNVGSHSEGSEPKRYVVVTYIDENEED